MVIVNFGIRNMVIGQPPVLFDAISFRDARAYSFFGQFQITNPQEVYSRVIIKTLVDIPNFNNLIGHQRIELDIQPNQFIFLIPFSNLYNGNGTFQIQAERLSNIRGTKDGDSPVTLEIIYDDANDIRTWL